jgi:excisionase family DNA binding protein
LFILLGKALNHEQCSYVGRKKFYRKQELFMDQPQFYTITQAVTILNVSRPTICRKIKAGEIPAVHLGGRVLIPAVFFENLTAKAMALQDEGTR